jgi:NAD(P)-dependent dehydrogenase (short-subunit alcohol dehydrogenase family)
MGKLQDKIAIVTGGSRGIGKAIALRLAAEGAKVVVTATTKAGADKAAAEIQQSGGQAMGFEANVADPTKAPSINSAACISSSTMPVSRATILSCA